MSESLASAGDAAPPSHDDPLQGLVARHLRLGWLSLLLYATLGLLLETLHAFKLGWYLELSAEPRRLSFTLAHAHGVGLALLNIGFAATLHMAFRQSSAALELGARLMRLATLLIPLGFFGGGLAPYDGDPGVLVFLVPPGALMLVASLILVTLALLRALRDRSA